MLEGAGFSTVSVGNGIDGVQAVLTYEPMITTLDVNLPGIDGFEAARRIRSRNSDTYIVMLTGQGDEADVVLGLAAGADDLITKPFRPRGLRAHRGDAAPAALHRDARPGDPGARDRRLLEVDPLSVIRRHGGDHRQLHGFERGCRLLVHRQIRPAVDGRGDGPGEHPSHRARLL